MTLRVDAAELVGAIEVATMVCTIAAVLVFGLIVYLMVRPRRQPRNARPPEDMALDRDLLRLMERMEQRLEIMERAVAARAPEEDRFLHAGAEGPETRRRK